MTVDPIDPERVALVALLRLHPSGSTWSQLATEMADNGSPSAVWLEHFPADLFSAQQRPAALAEAERDIRAWLDAGLEFRTFLDDDYPAQLREISEFPPVLFHRGTLRAADVGVAVVGSRAASARGLALASGIATELARNGISVVSGLARGIDTAAHTAALAAGGRTVAVIGTGITHSYPSENRALQQQVAATGLLLSQFWPDTPPRPHQFPMRNAVMSGYGRATVVVEAGEKSGARIQARQAVAHGRPVILTELVVEANTWARELVGRPGVQVASGVREVAACAVEAVDQGEQVRLLLEAALR